MALLDHAKRTGNVVGGLPDLWDRSNELLQIAPTGGGVSGDARMQALTNQRRWTSHAQKVTEDEVRKHRPCLTSAPGLGCDRLKLALRREKCVRSAKTIQKVLKEQRAREPQTVG